MCYECGCYINRGETYTRTVGSCEGDFYYMAEHPSCIEFCEKVNADARADEFMSIEENYRESGLSFDEFFAEAPDEVKSRFAPELSEG